jgi:AcrR family transcriptional regulator
MDPGSAALRALAGATIGVQPGNPRLSANPTSCVNMTGDVSESDVPGMKSSSVQKERPRADGILEAAFELFSSKGYADVSMKEIARKTNTTYSLIYYYYKNKDDIFYSSIRYAIKIATESYRNAEMEDSDPVSAINKWLDLNIELAEPLKRLCRIMLENSDRRQNAPSVEKDITYFYRFERRLLTDSIRRGIGQGVFHCDNPDDLAAFVSTGIDGIFYGALVRPDMNIERSINSLRSNLWTLLNFEEAPDRHT